MKSLREYPSKYIRFILGLALLLQPNFSYAQNQLPSVAVADCESGLQARALNRRLPLYADYLALFKRNDAEKAFQLLREIMQTKLSAKARAAAMFAFLDCQGAGYGQIIDGLTHFRVRYTNNILSRSLGVTLGWNHLIIFGRGKPRDDLDLVQTLFKLAQTLTMIPLKIERLPLPWFNGRTSFPFKRRPFANFVDDTMNDLKTSGERLTRTFDFLHALEPDFHSEIIQREPNVLGYQDIYLAVFAALLPLGEDVVTNHALTNYVAPTLTAGAAFLVFYPPWRGKLTAVGAKVRSRLKLYWWTSNMARSLFLLSSMYGVYFTYDLAQPDANPRAIPGAAQILGAESDDLASRASDAQTLNEEITNEQALVEQWSARIKIDPSNPDLRLHLDAEQEFLRGLRAQQLKVGK